jgi:hypothetical protein
MATATPIKIANSSTAATFAHRSALVRNPVLIADESYA